MPLELVFILLVLWSLFLAIITGAAIIDIIVEEIRKLKKDGE